MGWGSAWPADAMSLENLPPASNGAFVPPPFLIVSGRPSVPGCLFLGSWDVGRCPGNRILFGSSLAAPNKYFSLANLGQLTLFGKARAFCCPINSDGRCAHSFGAGGPRRAGAGAQFPGAVEASSPALLASF